MNIAAELCKVGRECAKKNFCVFGLYGKLGVGYFVYSFGCKGTAFIPNMSGRKFHRFLQGLSALDFSRRLPSDGAYAGIFTAFSREGRIENLPRELRCYIERGYRPDICFRL